MARRCAAANCEAVSHLFSWPKDPSTSSKWTSWVKLVVVNFEPSKHKRLCWRHFATEDFTNYSAYVNGFSSILKLNPKVIPSRRFSSEAESNALMTPRRLKQAQDGQPLAKRERQSILREALNESTQSHQETQQLIQQQKDIRIMQVTEKRKRKEKEDTTPVAARQRLKENQRSRATMTSVYLMRPKRRSIATQTTTSSSTPAHTEPIAQAVELEEQVIEASTQMEEEQLYKDDMEEEDDDVYDIDDPEDDDYIPEEAELSEVTQEDAELLNDLPEEFYSEKKFIVSLSSLHSLISSCTECGKETKYVNTVNQGAYSEFEIVCHYCTAIRTWSTTSKINQYPAINHFISGSILFTGAPATKVLRVLDFIGLTAPSYQNYISIQRNYLFGTMNEVYEEHMDAMVSASTMDGPLHLAADGRHDSPGHCSLYGIVSFMDCATGHIVASQLVKSTEVENVSNRMETEGFHRCREEVEGRGAVVASITTDRNRNVGVYIREEWKTVVNYFDTWHISKSIKKKLSAQAKVKGYGDLHLWIKSITNHLYWTVTYTADRILRKSVFTSLLNHVTDIHVHDNSLFPACLHGVLDANKVFIQKGSAVDIWLRKTLTKTQLLNDISKASVNTTSDLESFHSVLNYYAPKAHMLSYDGMTCRLQNTILYCNENGNRPAARYKTGPKKGQIMYHITRGKQNKLEPRAKELKVPPTFNHVKTLLSRLEGKLWLGRKVAVNRRQPKTLHSTGPQIPRDLVIEARERMSRGLKTKTSRQEADGH